MNTFTTLPSGWSLELDGDISTVYAPGQQSSCSLSCALDCGEIDVGSPDGSTIHIPANVMRALVRHARALECKAVALRDTTAGEFIIRTPNAGTVYKRGDYDRAGKKYSCTDVENWSREIFLDGDAIVYVDFSY